MPRDHIDDKSTLILVMAWGRLQNVDPVLYFHVALQGHNELIINVKLSHSSFNLDMNSCVDVQE